MLFFAVFFRQPVACNDVLRYMVSGLDCIVLCIVLVLVDYISSIVASSNTCNDFVDRVVGCADTMFDRLHLDVSNSHRSDF